MSNALFRRLFTEECNGATFVTIDTVTAVTLRGGKSNPFQGRVVKQVLGSRVMVFQNKHTNGYENMVERRLKAEGKDPRSFELSERTWGQRVPNTPIIEHNGADYLEVIFLQAGDVSVLVDGVETDPSTIEGYPTKQEAHQGGLDNKVIIRTYALESIVALTINKQRYERA